MDKSIKEDDHIIYLLKTFFNFRKGTQTNPDKYIFEVRKGKLLECLFFFKRHRSQSRKKIKAIIDMQPAQNKKHVQRLPNRFISMLVDQKSTVFQIIHKSYIFSVL